MIKIKRQHVKQLKNKELLVHGIKKIVIIKIN